MNDTQPEASAGMVEALNHLESALGILDEVGAPAHVGAHVDLAICRLKESLGIVTKIANEN